jgi:2-succinyl-5-enolpyruvyl-6-hydroxy-3-cyclohexene-1-carboxylate synthase
MAQQSGATVVLVCTSGSAAYNFAPAVAEAFFQNIPLIVFTADRPAEWIDQYDGQTIHQKNIYGTHAKKYFDLPHDLSNSDVRWHAGRIANEALLIATADPKGPVHINAPFREPLYPVSPTKTSEAFRTVTALKGQSILTQAEWDQVIHDLGQCSKVLVVAGQQQHDAQLMNTLGAIQESQAFPITGDILSNLHGAPVFCSHADSFLGQMPDASKEALVPDLVITFGKSLVAKNLKLFLRKHKPAHWHIGQRQAADTFQSLTKIVPVDPLYFFKELSAIKSLKQNTGFAGSWQRAEEKARVAVKEFFKRERKGEFALIEDVMNALPANCNLHLANSMSVRYANHIGLNHDQQGITVYSNRGTSGIDGCSSTAAGHALASDIPNVLITGDLAFFYDRNAFWHNYAIPNLFVVVINNHGGIIFNLIDGPASQPEADEYFITKQNLNAKALASEFGFDYIEANAVDLKGFFKQGRSVRILESNTQQEVNKNIFIEFRKHLKKTYEA